MELRSKIEDSLRYISERWDREPYAAVITGSGLDYMAEMIQPEVVIPYKDIPHFCETSVTGHPGRLILGTRAGRGVVVLQGRSHYYEGYSMEQIVHPVRTLGMGGTKALLVTSAVGGISRELRKGHLVLVKDHINLVQQNPVLGCPNEFGPRFLDLMHLYSPRLREAAKRHGAQMGLDIPEGVLAFVTGPCFETRAELNWLRLIGADMVGWSLVPEAIAANQLGIKILALALVTDCYHSEVSPSVDLDDVFSVGYRARDKYLPFFEACLDILLAT